MLTMYYFLIKVVCTTNTAFKFKTILSRSFADYNALLLLSYNIKENAFLNTAFKRLE